MKNIKKIFSLVIAFVMMFGFALTTLHAQTATPPTTITINNAVEGKEYKAYKLFDGERQTRDRDVHHLILHNHAYKQPLPQASEKATRLP